MIAPITQELQKVIRRPQSEPHKRLGYLLGWSLVLDRYSIGSASFRAALGTYLRRSGLISPFMQTLFQLIDLNRSTLPSEVPSPQLFKVAGEPQMPRLYHNSICYVCAQFFIIVQRYGLYEGGVVGMLWSSLVSTPAPCIPCTPSLVVDRSVRPSDCCISGKVSAHDSKTNKRQVLLSR